MLQKALIWSHVIMCFHTDTQKRQRVIIINHRIYYFFLSLFNDISCTLLYYRLTSGTMLFIMDWEMYVKNQPCLISSKCRSSRLVWLEESHCWFPKWNALNTEIISYGLDRPWGPPSILFNGFRVSYPEIKRPERDVVLSPPSSTDVSSKYLYSPYTPSWRRHGQLYVLPFVKYKNNYVPPFCVSDCNG